MLRLSGVIIVTMKAMRSHDVRCFRLKYPPEITVVIINMEANIDEKVDFFDPGSAPDDEPF